MTFTTETAKTAAAKQNIRSEEEVTTILMALIAWAGNASAASRYLRSEKKIAIDARTLGSWKMRYSGRIDELREKFSEQLEANLAHEMRDVARLAVETERLAIEKARDLLAAGEEKDPSRAAANLSRVAQSSTDKLLSLTGRPTSITENRDVGAILRSLQAKGVLQLPAVPAEIEEKT